MQCGLETDTSLVQSPALGMALGNHSLSSRAGGCTGSTEEAALQDLARALQLWGVEWEAPEGDQVTQGKSRVKRTLKASTSPT